MRGLNAYEKVCTSYIYWACLWQNMWPDYLVWPHILPQTGSIFGDIVSENKQLAGSVTKGIYISPSYTGWLNILHTIAFWIKTLFIRISDQNFLKNVLNNLEICAYIKRSIQRDMKSGIFFICQIQYAPKVWNHIVYDSPFFDVRGGFSLGFSQHSQDLVIIFNVQS